MSTQFDTATTAVSTAGVGEKKNVAAVPSVDLDTTAAAAKWPTSHHDHQQQLATAHIAVHTPIHAPRGSSCESQSLPSYSNGSPQAGFHVPANGFRTATPTSCATSTPYARQMCFEPADGKVELASESDGASFMAALESDAYCRSELQKQQQQELQHQQQRQQQQEFSDFANKIKIESAENNNNNGSWEMSGSPAREMSNRSLFFPETSAAEEAAATAAPTTPTPSICHKSSGETNDSSAGSSALQIARQQAETASLVYMQPRPQPQFQCSPFFGLHSPTSTTTPKKSPIHSRRPSSHLSTNSANETSTAATAVPAAFGSGNNNSSSSSVGHAEALAAGIAAPRPIRSGSPYSNGYDNSNKSSISSNPNYGEERLHSMLDFVSAENGSSTKRDNCWESEEMAKKISQALSEVGAEKGKASGEDVAAGLKMSNAINMGEEVDAAAINTAPGTSTAAVGAAAAAASSAENAASNSNGEPNNQFYCLGKPNSRTFFRAPGLEAPDMAQMAMGDSKIRVCPVCSFSCKSKFHYNSHMNTHGDHQCTMCNYTSRTEGRLRKHMRESHTRDQRIRAGLEEPGGGGGEFSNSNAPPLPPYSPSSGATAAAAASAPPNASASSAKHALHFNASDATALEAATGISTTMASIVDMVNRAAAAASSTTTTATGNANAPMRGSAAHELLRMVESSAQSTNLSSSAANAYSDALSNLNFISGAANTARPSTSSNVGALEQIKALTERANNSLSNAQFSSALNEILGISASSAATNGHDAMARAHNEGGRNSVGVRDPTDDDDDLENESSHGATSSAAAGDGGGGGATQPHVPRRSGRPKIYKCKQCQHVSTSKEQSWAHNKTHIPLDKQLTCSQCGFVTEYKHHLEYHMRNHKGSKPFKCSKCAYTCVNKSMLNSHMKSHTPIYQYRCQDCTYQTKYCHSLKMHLEKYRHTRMPGTVEIDSDGEEKPISEGDIEDYGGIDSGEIREEDHHGHGIKSVEMDETAQSGTSHPTLNSMLLQPIVTSSSIQQYTDQIQQYSNLRQLEQMNEILRAANSNPYSCTQCDYTTASNEELLRHNMEHLLASSHQQQHHQQQQQQQQQQQSASLANLYQNLAAAQQQLQQQQQNQELMVGQQQQQQQQNMQISSQQQQTINGVLGAAGTDLLNGILQPDSSTKELAAQLQQELLRAQATVQQQQQQQQQEEERRQAVAAALAAAAANSLANNNSNNNNSSSSMGSGGAVSNNALASAILNHRLASSATSMSGGGADSVQSHSSQSHASSLAVHHSHDAHHHHHANQHHVLFSSSHMPSSASVAESASVPTAASDVNHVSHGMAASVRDSSHFPSSTTTTASSFGFGNDDEELQLAHSLSPTASSGRRGSVGSASTSGGESTSKTCSISPGSENLAHGGSRKRKPSKTIKVDQISVKLRDKADDPKRHKLREHTNGEHVIKNNNNGSLSKSSSSDCGDLRTRSNTNGSASGEESSANFSTLLAQFNKLQRQNQMPHSCQHCMIAFQDRALYQIHLGYHGYETPFKCNRCGHLSDSSLEFNLHLYQAKHD